MQMYRAGVLTLALTFAASLSAAAPDRRVADAAKARDRTALQSLLKQHADVNGTQGDGATALHWAAHWDDADAVRALIAAGANVNVATDQGVTPLTLAAMNGSAPTVEALLKAGAKPNAASGVGETALMVAAHSGSARVVTALLDAGADLKATEASAGQTALMRAVAENHADVVGLLLDRGADVSARSKNRFTALLFAAQQGNIEIAQRLLKAGANVNDTAPDGIAGDTNALRTFKPDTEASALLVAIDSGHEAMALSCSPGVDPNQSEAGRTAPLAVQRAMPNVAGAAREGRGSNARTFRRCCLSRYINQQTGLDTPQGARRSGGRRATAISRRCTC